MNNELQTTVIILANLLYTLIMNLNILYIYIGPEEDL
jgi:hypothetical protein